MCLVMTTVIINIIKHMISNVRLLGRIAASAYCVCSDCNYFKLICVDRRGETGAVLIAKARLIAWSFAGARLVYCLSCGDRGGFIACLWKTEAGLLLVFGRQRRQCGLLHVVDRGCVCKSKPSQGVAF